MSKPKTELEKGKWYKVKNPNYVPDKYLFDGKNLTVTFPVKLTELDQYEEIEH